MPRFDDEFPACSAVMQRLEKPEVAYLAGLFHDIAKGRGGDHSELGAVDAEAFCLEHGMSRYDARLVAWLVQHHLLLSLTAQKKDLNDPNVVNEFARTVGDQTHLDYLYVLTVADVRGTNPKIWNSWKDTLFWELYQSTRRALRRGVSNPIDKEELIRPASPGRAALLQAGLPPDRWQHIWSTFTEEYFLRHRPEEIAWHTRVLAESANPGSIIVDVNERSRPGSRRSAVFARGDTLVHARDGGARRARPHDRRRPHRAAVRDAEPRHLLRARKRRQPNLRQAQARRDPAPLAESALTSPSDQTLKVTRRAPRQVRMFSTPVQITISQDPRTGEP